MIIILSAQRIAHPWPTTQNDSIMRDMNNINSHLIIRYLGKMDYQKTWENMRNFTDMRHDETCDEMWFLEHPPVFTQGLAGKAEHILNPRDIPVVQTDRGGQVTYHGPGQLVVYVLIDLKRKQLHARELVKTLENSVIELLSTYQIAAESRCDAPGVYVQNQKICSIGLRIRKNCSYHGIALNVDMDLTPFTDINPCGHRQLQMTQMKTLNPAISFHEVQQAFIAPLMKKFRYNAHTITRS